MCQSLQTILCPWPDPWSSKLKENITVVIPAKNEGSTVGDVVGAVKRVLPGAQVIVVDDGSTDSTAEDALKSGATVVSHPYSLGNGAAIKSGARRAEGDVIVFMDGDGQHQAHDIPRLLARLDEGFDLVVGARDHESQANAARGIANRFYNWLASYMTGQKVEDLTSGFRVVKRAKFLEFLSLLPNGFSYPTTSTMAFFRAGYSVAYETISVQKRIGQSHIRMFKDGARFLLIIFKIGTLYSPLKLFLPLSMLLFLLGGGYYGYTYYTFGRFTNMSALLFTTSVLIFLMGLVSEQITQLMYRDAGHSKTDFYEKTDPMGE